MKSLTQTLVAASLVFGATAANAAIERSSDLNAEAWLSVYDTTSQQTFTLDLGVAGLTLGTLKSAAADTTFSVSIDLTAYDDWNTFVSTADLTTTSYAIAVNGQDGFQPNFMVTGTDTTKFVGATFIGVQSVANRISTHALNINADANTQSGGLSADNDTTLVVDGDAFLAHHNDDTGSTNLWGGAAFDPNASYGEANKMQLIELDQTLFTGVQSELIGEWILADNVLSYGAAPAAIPVPAAVWMFASALVGLLGVSRRKTA